MKARFIALLVLLGAPGVAISADDIPIDEAVAAEIFEDEPSVLDLFDRARKLRPRVALGNETVVGLPHDEADVHSFTERFRASVAAPVGDSLIFRVSGQIEATLFEFDGDRRFLDTGRRSGDPFDELLSNDVALEGRYAINEDWALLSGLSYGSSWERGSRYRDAIDLHGVLGVAYTFRDTLSFVVGARAGSRIGGSVSFSPVIRAGWRITKDIELETERIGLRLTVRVTKGLAVYLSGRRSSNSWALEDRGGNIGKSRLRDRRIPVLLGARWKLSKHWRLRGFVGAIATQKYTVTDRNGDTIDRERSNGPAFTFQLDLEYRF